MADGADAGASTPLDIPFDLADIEADKAYAALVDLIDESPLNHRTWFRRLDELADSIEEHGVKVALLARPSPTTPGRYELVYGHRRLRGVKLLAERRVAAGLALDHRATHVPCRIRALTDYEVLIEQALENLDREDPHPLEEAIIFERFHKPRAKGGEGLSLEEIAGKLHKAVPYIVERLKLVALHKPARQAFLEETILLGHAFLLARVENEKLQEEALHDILGRGQWNGGETVMTVAAAREHIKRKYMLMLAKAPFEITDATLRPEAGACNGCPHNTGTQAVLFADVAGGGDLCTKPACYQEKVESDAKRKLEAHKKAGGEVLSAGEAKKLFPHHSSHMDSRSKYADLHGQAHEIGIYNGKTIANTLGKKTIAALPVALVQDPHSGEIRRLVVKADAIKVVKERKKDKGSTADEIDDSRARVKLDEKKKQERDRRTLEVLRRAMAAVVAVFGKREEITEALLRILVRVVVGGSWSDTQKLVVARRQLEPEKKKGKGKGKGPAVWNRETTSAALLLKHLEGLKSKGELIGFAFEIALSRGLATHMSNRGADLKEVCKLLKIDVAKLEKEVAAETKESAKAKQKKRGVKGVAGAGAKGSKGKATPPGTKAKKTPATRGKATKGRAATATAKAIPDEDLDEDEDEDLDVDDDACRVCKCTEDNACVGGCSWVESDLCSRCAEFMDAIVEHCQEAPRTEAELFAHVSTCSDAEDCTAERVRAALEDLVVCGEVFKVAGERYYTKETLPDAPKAPAEASAPTPGAKKGKGSGKGTGKKGVTKASAASAASAAVAQLAIDCRGWRCGAKAGAPCNDGKGKPRPAGCYCAERTEDAERAASASAPQDPELAIACPKRACAVRPGELCKSPKNKPYEGGGYHIERTRAAKGEPPTIPAPPPLAPRELTEETLLASLVDEGPDNITALAIRFGRSPAAPSQMMINLQSREFVVFDKKGGRVWRVTEAGRARVAEQRGETSVPTDDVDEIAARTDAAIAGADKGDAPGSLRRALGPSPLEEALWERVEARPDQRILVSGNNVLRFAKILQVRVRSARVVAADSSPDAGRRARDLGVNVVDPRHPNTEPFDRVVLLRQDALIVELERAVASLAADGRVVALVEHEVAESLMTNDPSRTSFVGRHRGALVPAPGEEGLRIVVLFKPEASEDPLLTKPSTPTKATRGKRPKAAKGAAPAPVSAPQDPRKQRFSAAIDVPPEAAAAFVEAATREEPALPASSEGATCELCTAPAERGKDLCPLHARVVARLIEIIREPPTNKAPTEKYLAEHAGILADPTTMIVATPQTIRWGIAYLRGHNLTEVKGGGYVLVQQAEPSPPPRRALTKDTLLASLVDEGPGAPSALATRFGVTAMALSSSLLTLQSDSLIAFDKAGRKWGSTAFGCAHLEKQREADRKVEDEGPVGVDPPRESLASMAIKLRPHVVAVLTYGSAPGDELTWMGFATGPRPLSALTLAKAGAELLGIEYVGAPPEWVKPAVELAAQRLVADGWAKVKLNPHEPGINGNIFERVLPLDRSELLQLAAMNPKAVSPADYLRAAGRRALPGERAAGDVIRCVRLESEERGPLTVEQLASYVAAGVEGTTYPHELALAVVRGLLVVGEAIELDGAGPFVKARERAEVREAKAPPRRPSLAEPLDGASRGELLVIGRSQADEHHRLLLAGDGVTPLARHFAKRRPPNGRPLVVIEQDDDARAALVRAQDPLIEVLELDDILHHAVSAVGQEYDRIILPRDMDSRDEVAPVLHAYKLLRPESGRLLAILDEASLDDPRIQELLKRHNGTSEPLGPDKGLGIGKADARHLLCFYKLTIARTDDARPAPKRLPSTSATRGATDAPESGPVPRESSESSEASTA